MCVLCEWLGFSFEVNNIFSTLMFSLPAIFWMCSTASSGFNWTGKKKNITMTPRHRILCAKLPDGHLKFECSVLCSNVDFYFKFYEYSKFKKKLTALRLTPPPLQPLQQCWQHSYVYFPNTTSGYDAEHVHSTSLVDHGEACSEWNLSC